MTTFRSGLMAASLLALLAGPALAQTPPPTGAVLGASQPLFPRPGAGSATA